MAQSTGYFSSTTHPWPSFLFLVPLLAIYEGGVIWLGGTQAQNLRNGADVWVRWGLEQFLGFKQMLAAPVIVAVVLFFWSLWRWGDRPTQPLRVCFGMGLESVFFGFGLLFIARNFGNILGYFGVQVNLPAQFSTEQMAQLLTYIGAGIYEELLFRLILFTGIATLLRFAFVPGLIAIPFAGIVSALLFAAAHHVGPYGEPFDDPPRFVFRVTAGLYFTVIFWLRGFGVAVGAHAAYDILLE